MKACRQCGMPRFPAKKSYRGQALYCSAECSRLAKLPKARPTKLGQMGPSNARARRAGGL